MFLLSFSFSFFFSFAGAPPPKKIKCDAELLFVGLDREFDVDAVLSPISSQTDMYEIVAEDIVNVRFLSLPSFLPLVLSHVLKDSFR